MFFAKRRLLKKGERATATVVSCEQRSNLTTNELRDYDRAGHRTVFDLDGDPRYDVDAMNEQTAKVKAETRELRKRMGR